MYRVLIKLSFLPNKSPVVVVGGGGGEGLEGPYNNQIVLIFVSAFTCHEQNKSNTHKCHSPPVFLDPFNVSQDSLLAKELVFQTGQRPVSIHSATFEEYIAVTVKVVARGTGELLKTLVLHVGNVGSWFAFAICSIFAAHVTEVIFLFALALQQIEFKANGASALLRNTKDLHTVNSTLHLYTFRDHMRLQVTRVCKWNKNCEYSIERCCTVRSSDLAVFIILYKDCVIYPSVDEIPGRGYSHQRTRYTVSFTFQGRFMVELVGKSFRVVRVCALRTKDYYRRKVLEVI